MLTENTPEKVQAIYNHVKDVLDLHGVSNFLIVMEVQIEENPCLVHAGEFKEGHSIGMLAVAIEATVSIFDTLSTSDEENEVEENENITMPDLNHKKRMQKFLGIASEKFLELVLDNDLIALYLDQQCGEDHIYDSFEDTDLVYGFIALNWHVEHNILYEYAYAKLSEKAPVTQDDFDLCLEELLLLPVFNQKSKEN